jgi:hypothetical protein
MSKKIKIVLALVVMLGLAGAVQADVVYFWGNTSGNWASTTTWAGGAVPSPTSVNQDIAILIGGVTVDVTSNGQGAIDFYFGYSSGINTLNIGAAKSFLIAHTTQIGLGDDTSEATGILNVYGTYYSEGMTIGCNKLTIGIINVYDGGAVNVGAWGLTVGKATAGTVGTGTINLKGGILTTASPVTINPTGLINIEAGTLKVLGNYQTALQAYVNSGRIVSRSGSSPHCTLAVSYVDGYTYVKSAGCTCVTYLPADLNHDCYVDMYDLTSLAQNWLACTVPTDANCM